MHAVAAAAGAAVTCVRGCLRDRHNVSADFAFFFALLAIRARRLLDAVQKCERLRILMHGSEVNIF
jgi:hypothetical protein